MIEAEKQQIDFIESSIRGILDRLCVRYDLEFQEGSDGVWFLIGEGGKNLSALNYLVKKIAEKKYPERFPGFSLDINDYQKKKIDEIKELARMHAQRVRYFKKEAEMRPMNAYERRIVHASLQEYPDITTESRGEGMERRVVIKPLNLV